MVTKCGGVNQVLKCNITKYNGTYKIYNIHTYTDTRQMFTNWDVFTLNFLLNTNFTHDQRIEWPIEHTSSNRISSGR